MVLLALLFAALFVAGCGSVPPRRLPLVMPENITAHPSGTAGVVALAERSNIATAMRALGLPFRRLRIDTLHPYDLDGLATIIVEEGALDDPRVVALYPILLEHARDGNRLVVLEQRPEALLRLQQKTPQPIAARRVEYRLTFQAPRPDHPLLTRPNAITRTDLDSLGSAATILAHGSGGAQAIIAGNLQHPDSSAALLREPMGRGTVWLFTFPLTANAALGHAAEQKLVANLMSLGKEL